MLPLNTAESWTDPCHLHTKLVNESCALHTAMALIAWKPLCQRYMCSSLYGALMGIKQPPTSPITLDIPAILKKSAIVSCQRRTKFVCIEFWATSSLSVSSRIPAKFKVHHSLSLLEITPLCPQNSKMSPMFVCCNENMYIFWIHSFCLEPEKFIYCEALW